ncbi:MAG: toprim domain-containing protein, partial [Chloroflexota bacterium]
MAKYTLIITEKPDAAQKIASALDANGKPRKAYEKGTPYYVAERNGRSLAVVPAFGHLYTVAAEKGQTKQYPIFGFTWAPRHVAERGAQRTRFWVEAISKLAKDADAFVDACDYDIEGSIIGYNILKHACNGKERKAQRMKYSALTKEELEQSFKKLLSHLDFPLIEAGLARHEVDWLYGINLSRALT